MDTAMDTSLTRTHGVYTVSDDPARLDAGAIHSYLKRAYWSEEIPLEIVERALRASLCIGAYDANGAQVGLTRLISDYATFCYVCDVYVLEAHRGNGLSKAMMAMAVEHPRLQGLRRWSLVTLDAHGLYDQFGFVPPANPERYMERLAPDIYKRSTTPGGGR
jgi:GNAT superfamily N-acetyltransferase